jgi:hypothetical protein
MLRLVRLLVTGSLFIAFTTPSWTLAQADDDSWAQPLNLSHSGVGMNPAIVPASESALHVVWQDDLANYLYTQFDGDQWSAPEMTNLNLLFRLPGIDEPISPQLAIYSGPNPLFVAGLDQYIYAFWISPEGSLFTSKVENQFFKDVAAWDSGRLIAREVASFAVDVDARGELHLAYFRTVEDTVNPAGIYYTQSDQLGRTWSVPELLYESPYLRRLEEGEAGLSLATAGTEEAPHLYIAWDNWRRKQVLLAQSADGGESWEQPTLIAGPAPGSGLAGPFNIQVSADQNSVVLVWQNGQPEDACSQVYQSSSDAGVTWSDPQPIIEDLLGCTQSNRFVSGLPNNPDGPEFFLTETKSQVFLTAWNGLQWSTPQAQSILSGFEEPEIFTEVIYGCHRESLLGERLYIVGCDQGVGGDVWVTSRDMGPIMSLFSSPTWSHPSPVTDDPLEMEAIELVATSDDLIHAFFSQLQDPVIYYAYWDGEIWSQITPVLELPEGEAARPSIAAGPENELFLLTPNNRGALYFSRAASGNAASESRWSTPSRLATGHDGEIGLADVAWDAAGTIFVTYSVPVNEARGIYLVQSKDHGATWSEPLRVFNGTAAGFDLVGAPSLVLSENGYLHITWRQQSIQGDGVSQPLSLFYIRSEDSGRTFRNAELVVEEPVNWQELVADNEGNLHLLWQPQDTMTTVWDQVSFDGGRSWQVPQGLPNEGTTPSVLVDSVGRLHLVDAGLESLGYWFWGNSRWQPEAPFHWSLTSQQEGRVKILASAINEQGKMVIVMAVPTGADDAPESILLYSTRTIELPPNQISIQEVPTQKSLSPTLTPATLTPEPSPTAATTVESEPTSSQDQTDRNEGDDRISSTAMALLPVALLLLIVLGIVIRRATRAEDR